MRPSEAAAVPAACFLGTAAVPAACFSSTAAVPAAKIAPHRPFRPFRTPSFLAAKRQKRWRAKHTSLRATPKQVRCPGYNGDYVQLRLFGPSRRT